MYKKRFYIFIYLYSTWQIVTFQQLAAVIMRILLFFTFNDTTLWAFKYRFPTQPFKTLHIMISNIFSTVFHKILSSASSRMDYFLFPRPALCFSTRALPLSLFPQAHLPIPSVPSCLCPTFLKCLFKPENFLDPTTKFRLLSSVKLYNVYYPQWHIIFSSVSWLDNSGIWVLA